ncbi:hypothetical protein [Corynebacterium ureicelerivorans]|uniref:hypothetical protein n=1 Tax=Corynebacterium ureicelerivorans TaxID=401472 RepID=UPI0020669B2C|nr:hypothetical protein [Corynebacterium ureicelerivorans]DAI67995.1 MAG TPA: hypothetical protein [Caudoviricetes sp.]
MSVLGALLDFATISLAVYTLWKHRHDRLWQAGTLAILAGLYFLLVPHWLRGFSAVH